MEKYTRFNRQQVLYIILILATAAWLIFVQQFIPAAILLILLLLLFVITNQRHIFKKQQWDKFINDSIKKLKPSLLDAARDAEFPMVAVTRDGRISWYNTKFMEVAGIDEGSFPDIDDILSIDPEDIWEGDLTEFIPLDERIYKPTTVTYSAAAGEFEEDLMFIHLTDYSEVKRAEDRKVVTMLVEVDNLSEVLNSAPEAQRPFISAEIEKILFNYANSLKGYMKKYAPNKNIIFAPFEIFREETKRKFPILERIKSIDLGNTIEPTVSIGAAYDSDYVMEDGLAAEQAKELALGRGGDQVVIKQGDKLSFFGGNTREVEKKSRVRSRVVAHALRDLMNASGQIYIMGHTNPDMDSLGSAIGIFTIARALGKEAYILLDEPYRNVAEILRLIREEEVYEDAFISSESIVGTIDPNDLLIIVDVHSLSYVLNKEAAQANTHKVIIDHHRRAQDAISGATLSYIETYASSTSELVTELIQYIVEKPKLLKIEADALLAGIMVDTKSFMFKTGSRTFEAASFLRKAGGNTLDIRSWLSYDKDLYLLKAAIIKTGEVERGVAIAVTPSGIKDPLIVAQAADEFLNLKGIRTSFVLAQDKEDVVISARSDGYLNVQVIMEAFGGGGHMAMSGARVKDSTTDVEKAKLKEILKTAITEDEEDENNTASGRQERR